MLRSPNVERNYLRTTLGNTGRKIRIYVFHVEIQQEIWSQMLVIDRAQASLAHLRPCPSEPGFISGH